MIKSNKQTAGRSIDTRTFTTSDDAPLVSVIVTCYNYGQYLTEAVDSALNQTYPKVEVIVVDDGSTDDTAEIAKKYKGRIKYIFQENAGVVAARNNGANLAQGEYLCFLDADDYLDSEYLKAILSAFVGAADDVAYVYGDAYLLRNGQKQFQKSPPYSTSHLMYKNFVPTRSVIRTPAFKQIGGFRADDSRGYSFEDWELWLDFAEGNLIGLHSEKHAVSYYRIHDKGRNVAGEKHGKELRAAIRKSHSKLYDDIWLRIGMLWYFLIHLCGAVWRRIIVNSD